MISFTCVKVHAFQGIIKSLFVYIVFTVSMLSIKSNVSPFPQSSHPFSTNKFRNGKYTVLFFLPSSSYVLLPRPKYRQKPSVSRSLSLSLKRAATSAEPIPLKRPLIKTPSMKMQELKSVVVRN